MDNKRVGGKKDVLDDLEEKIETPPTPGAHPESPDRIHTPEFVYGPTTPDAAAPSASPVAGISDHEIVELDDEGYVSPPPTPGRGNTPPVAAAAGAHEDVLDEIREHVIRLRGEMSPGAMSGQEKEESPSKRRKR